MRRGEEECRWCQERRRFSLWFTAWFTWFLSFSPLINFSPRFPVFLLRCSPRFQLPPLCFESIWLTKFWKRAFLTLFQLYWRLQDKNIWFYYIYRHGLMMMFIARSMPAFHFAFIDAISLRAFHSACMPKAQRFVGAETMMRLRRFLRLLNTLASIWVERPIDWITASPTMPPSAWYAARQEAWTQKSASTRAFSREDFAAPAKPELIFIMTDI